MSSSSSAAERKVVCVTCEEQQCIRTSNALLQVLVEIIEVGYLSSVFWNAVLLHPAAARVLVEVDARVDGLVQ